MTQPRLSQIGLWERHEARVLVVVRDALKLLAITRPTGGETDINREFYFCLLAANRDLLHRGEDAFDNPPGWNAPNPPSESIPVGPGNYKIPDFNWGYVDHGEPDARRSARYFSVECKRLGSRSKAGWQFNPRYIDDGVSRFMNPDWGYGRDTSSGAMVGYVENMAVEVVLAEVNRTAAARGVPALSRAIPSSAPIHEFEHTFVRSFPTSPYRLTHVWVEAPAPLSVG